MRSAHRALLARNASIMVVSIDRVSAGWKVAQRIAIGQMHIIAATDAGHVDSRDSITVMGISLLEA